MTKVFILISLLLVINASKVYVTKDSIESFDIQQEIEKMEQKLTSTNETFEVKKFYRDIDQPGNHNLSAVSLVVVRSTGSLLYLVLWNNETLYKPIKGDFNVENYFTREKIAVLKENEQFLMVHPPESELYNFIVPKSDDTFIAFLTFETWNLKHQQEKKLFRNIEIPGDNKVERKIEDIQTISKKSNKIGKLMIHKRPEVDLNLLLNKLLNNPAPFAEEIVYKSKITICYLKSFRVSNPGCRMNVNDLFTYNIYGGMKYKLKSPNELNSSEGDFVFIPRNRSHLEVPQNGGKQSVIFACQFPNSGRDFKPSGDC